MIGTPDHGFGIGVGHHPASTGEAPGRTESGSTTSFTVATVAELQDWAAHLDALGIPSSGVYGVDGMPVLLFTFEDPDGIHLERIVFGTEEPASEAAARGRTARRRLTVAAPARATGDGDAVTHIRKLTAAYHHVANASRTGSSRRPMRGRPARGMGFHYVNGSRVGATLDVNQLHMGSLGRRSADDRRVQPRVLRQGGSVED